MSFSAAEMMAKIWSIQMALDEAGIDHAPTIYREDAISIVANLSGEKWEIDVCLDGSIDFEVFKSELMEGEAELTAAIAKVNLENDKQG